MLKAIQFRYTRYIQRPIRAFFKLPGSRGFGILLITFALIVILSDLILWTYYVHPETEEPLDILAATYVVFTLLVFETAVPLPQSWIARLVFFLLPISGLLVLGQGLVRLGNAMFNRQVWSRAVASTYHDHTIVCGLGKVGLRTVRWLTELGEEVLVIDPDQNNQYFGELRSQSIPIIVGDARRADTLEDASVETAESIVACTSDDLLNVSIALEARRLRSDLKIVLRLFDTQIAENVRNAFDISTAFSIPDLVAPAFAAAATKAPLDFAFNYNDFGPTEQHLLTITKFTLVPESKLVGYTIEKLEDEFNVTVIARRHQGEFRLHPHDNEVLEAGDNFVVSASIEALNQVARLTPPLRKMDYYRQGRWELQETSPAPH